MVSALIVGPQQKKKRGPVQEVKEEDNGLTDWLFSAATAVIKTLDTDERVGSLMADSSKRKMVKTEQGGSGILVKMEPGKTVGKVVKKESGEMVGKMVNNTKLGETVRKRTTAQNKIPNTCKSKRKFRKMRKVEPGKLSIGGLSLDVQKLLMNKFVMVIGDSNHRSVYKDLVLLLQANTLLTDAEMKTKGEDTFLNDSLVAGGSQTNSINYLEEREYVTEYHRVQFYFVTRCYNDYIEGIFNQFSGATAPDLIIMNSCLWDLTRYGPDPISQYRNQMEMLCGRLIKRLRPDTRVVWTTTPPIAKQPRGGFLTPAFENRSKQLSEDVLRANFEARNIVIDHGFTVLDLHFWFRNMLELRAPDGVHWCGVAHRFMSELLLTSVAFLWDVPFLTVAPVCLLPRHPVVPRETEPAELKPLIAALQRLEQGKQKKKHSLAPSWRRPAPYQVPVTRPLLPSFRMDLPFSPPAHFRGNHRPATRADGAWRYNGAPMNACGPQHYYEPVDRNYNPGIDEIRTTIRCTNSLLREFDCNGNIDFAPAGNKRWPTANGGPVFENYIRSPINGQPWGKEKGPAPVPDNDEWDNDELPNWSFDFSAQYSDQEAMEKLKQAAMNKSFWLSELASFICPQVPVSPRNFQQVNLPGFTMPELPVPREFFDTWSDYTNGSFVGPQRRPYIAGRPGFLGYKY